MEYNLIPVEYKYEYLLTECKCGEKFHPRTTSATYSACFECRFPICTCKCGNVFDSFDGDKCHECLDYDEDDTTLRHRCTLCNSVFPSGYIGAGDEICSSCEDLEKRGKYIDIFLIGYPTGGKNGICTGCDNQLNRVIGDNCTCHGCIIEPLNCMMIKPAKR